ncbi:hypothetical protein SEA_ROBINSPARKLES_78 [Gordonia phage RobinSparkles]|nr:hypothetical protein SEA_ROBINSPARKLES_78 [Gordonia phage RobinSparkles]
MGWIKRKGAVTGFHECMKPTINQRVEIGDVWQCNECEMYWRVTNNWWWKPAPVYGFFVQLGLIK